MLVKVNEGINYVNTFTCLNAESNSKAALNMWKLEEASEEWNLSTADKIGVAVISGISKWKSSVDREYGFKLDQLKSDKERYEAENQAAINERHSYERVVNTGAHYGSDTSTNNKTAVSKGEIRITDQRRWNEANARAIEASNKVKQTENEIKKVNSLIDKNRKALNNFVEEVFKLKMMNESVLFMNGISTSEAVTDNSLINKIKTRLFYVSNKYRKDFDEFEKFLETGKEKFKKPHVTKTSSSLSYGASYVYKIDKKFAGEIVFKMQAKNTDEADLTVDVKKDFSFKKEQVEAAFGKIKENAKEFEIKNEGKVITILLSKKYENSELTEKIAGLEAELENYKVEGENLLKVAQENGASTSKLVLIGNKLTNWWKRSFFGKLFSKKEAEPQEQSQSQENSQPQESESEEK